MKIGIITLPLHTNYGGLLQAYALKKVLDDLGNEAQVLDVMDKQPLPPLWKAPLLYAWRLCKKMSGSSSVEVFKEIRFKKELPVISKYTQNFVNEYISPRMIASYKDVKKDEYQAFVVGSDQVWRPRYSASIRDAFLDFADGWDVGRVAYAASFGTEEMEFNSEDLERCSELLAEFDAVSVREDVAVGICEDWFSRDDAVHVLDPVLLLDADIYRNIAERSDDHNCKGKVMTYILDPSKAKDSLVNLIAAAAGKEVSHLYSDVKDRNLPVESRVVPPVERWLAGFCDADFIITDSFHGCVLAILLHKRFIAIGNSIRGMSRMNSLLSMFGLDDRLVQGVDSEDDGRYWLEDPDWSTIDSKLSARREESLAFLSAALNKGGK